MVRSAELVIQYTAGVSERDFMGDNKLQDAVIRRLLVVGEAAGRVSEAGREELLTIEWPQIRGMRNRLVHEYDNISLEAVWEIAQTEMENLVATIKPLLPTEDQLSILDES
ncbi:MAG: HepT-like ribonuclease domain-containing protein [Cyanobacteria bacterium J06623_4]